MSSLTQREEIFDVVTETGEVVGQARRSSKP